MRPVQVGERAGQTFPVEVPTTLQVLMQFASGVQSQSLYSTDSALLRHGVILVSGTLGTISLSDPNGFIGPVTITRPFKSLDDLQNLSQEVIEIAEEGPNSGRGLGVVEMARAIREDRPHQASAELAYHVLDTLLAVEEAAAKKQFIQVESTVEPLGSMPIEFNPYQRTLS